MPSTRRAYLTTVGTAAAVGLAGCAGDTGPGTTSHSCELTEREPVADLSQPVVGPSEATVTVDVFEDFACPHCADFATGGLSQLKTDYLAGETVRFRHFDFPIPVSDWSNRVANAARSVQQTQDDAAFFEFSLAAYENQADYSWQLIGDLADEVGADPCRVLSDASNATYEQVLSANRQTGIDRGVESTPGIFVNDTLIEPPESGGWYEPVSSAIDDAL
ncbi:DsbA family protein [Halonotius aquaticus]|uniref:DsbA family protein n=1 Tax=Halonotius aquaticus TaxID=2216978 RepID=A0A3A6PU92_9EURY|nr:thioredoxin domain-containing protein [Halonotius aquaticus]RJX42994.1 DsbA family protein [Halonotius aquaticus]